MPESNAVALFAEVSGTLPSDGHEIATGGTVVSALDVSALDVATPIHYQRRFVIEPELVRVRTDIDPVVSGTANGDDLAEAWETPPLFVAETSFGTRALHLFRPGEPWVRRLVGRLVGAGGGKARPYDRCLISAQ